jgi:hypothetical protein
VIRKGEPWGRPATSGPAVEVEGDDADLAAAASGAAGRLVRFLPGPGSDLGRALGLGGATPGSTEVALDTLAVASGPRTLTAVNAVVCGRRPDLITAWQRRTPVAVEIDGRRRYDGPAVTVVIANGQYLGGLDVVPRGHPGDGRLEVQVYALEPGQRAVMRRRLPQGAHVPHRGIVQATGRRVVVRWSRPVPLEVDGRPSGRVEDVSVAVQPGSLRLLV